MIGKFLKHVAARVDIDVYQRLSVHSMWRKVRPGFQGARRYRKREEVWDAAISSIGENSLVLYLEFGVFEGYSIRYFSERLINPESKFIGFDSFEGLPERWGKMSEGTFSTQGRVPDVRDSRVAFTRGWFQESLPKFLETLGDDVGMPTGTPKIFVHLDADLYSSTLFVLATLWSRFDNFMFCFDEFMGHELRAVHDFSAAFPSKLEYIAYDLEGGLPTHVFGEFSRV